VAEGADVVLDEPVEAAAFLAALAEA
jgi:hypothetical protein